MHELPSPSSLSLTIPTAPAYLRHVRVLAATVADDLGFDVEAIESLRIAVDELCALAIGDVGDPSATLTLTMVAEDGGLLLEGRCGPISTDPQVDPIAAQLIRAGADEYALRREGDDCVFSLRTATAAAAAAPTDGR